MIYDKDMNQIFERYLSVIEKNRIQQKPKRLIKEQKEKNAPTIDDETFKELDLRLARSRYVLQKTFPFYWRILNTLKTVMTYDVPTMAVDAIGNIYINPKFATQNLDQDGVTAVLVHECGHVVGLSFFRKGSRNHQLWNVATDYIINRDLSEDGFKLPDSDDFRALLPRKGVDGRWRIEKYGNVDITDFTAEKMYAFIENWQKKDPDKVEDDIEASEKFDQPIDPTGEEEEQEGEGEGQEGEGDSEGEGEGEGESGDKEGKGKGKGKGDKGEGEGEGEGKGKGKGSGSGESEQEGEGSGGGGGKPEEQKETEAKKKPKKPTPIQAPNNDERYEPNEADSKKDLEQQEKDLTDIIQKAYDQTLRENPGSASRGTGAGSGTGGLIKKEILKTKTDWKSLLRNFVGGLPTMEQNWRRPSSRYWVGASTYMPSEKLVKDKLDLIVAIDTSGSISSNQIHTFLNEVASIVSSRKTVKLKVLFWMDDVYTETNIDSKTMSLDKIKAELGKMKIRNDGGTYLSCVKQYLDSKQIKKIEGLIYFTDGHVEENPSIPKVEQNRILYLITPGGRTDILEKYAGRVVEVNIKY
ncbi:MAG: VWA domain-containing protein [Proteobacteria bacterium]|nr:VWA domain-containing protein [Pseudomonadota bacterium]NBP13003.1 VWA domain-containing protein [bacterium]